MACRVWLVLVLGLIVANRVGAQEAVTIKLKKAGKGDAVLIEQRANEESVMQLTDLGGKELKKQAEKKVKLVIYRETVLETTEGARRPSRVERVYEKAEVKLGVNTETLPLEGKTVLIEKGKDGKYTFRDVKGDGLKEDAMKILDEEFNKASEEFDMRKSFLPGKPVKVGDTWNIDPAPLVKDYASSLIVEAPKAKADGKLISLRKDAEGRLFGKMEFNVELPLNGFITPNGQKIPVAAGSKMAMTFTMEACIDGSVETGVLRTTFEMSSTATLPANDGTKLKMNLNSQVHAHERRTDPPPASK